MKDKNEAPLLLTVREVTQLLRVQRPKVYELIKDGAIDGFKVGADWRIRRDSVENLIGQIPEDFFENTSIEGEDEHVTNASYSQDQTRSAVIPE
jgi:excisionase family DNA binding protein